MIRVRTQPGAVICRYYSGLALKDAHGTVGRVRMQPKTVIWRYYNGLAPKDARGPKKRVYANRRDIHTSKSGFVNKEKEKNESATHPLAVRRSVA